MSCRALMALCSIFFSFFFFFHFSYFIFKPWRLIFDILISFSQLRWNAWFTNKENARGGLNDKFIVRYVGTGENLVVYCPLTMATLDLIWTSSLLGWDSFGEYPAWAHAPRSTQFNSARFPELFVTEPAASKLFFFFFPQILLVFDISLVIISYEDYINISSRALECTLIDARTKKFCMRATRKIRWPSIWQSCFVNKKFGEGGRRRQKFNRLSKNFSCQAV